MRRLADQTHPAFPVTIYYAFKQSENRGECRESLTRAGRHFLDAVIRSGFAVNRHMAICVASNSATGWLVMGTNSLASSIVLVCRPRPAQMRPSPPGGSSSTP